MKFKEQKAIYEQITDRICDELMNDVYPEGGRIISVREYAAAIQVNPNTVMRAYDWLQSEGIITLQRGVGYFVGKGAKRIIRKRMLEEFRKEYLPELISRINTLGITPEQLVEEIQEQTSSLALPEGKE
ncbi:MAG: GntR family transcriptional regulator [Bacteroidaceae bacterium]|nr:GntR family transcriptional regulator [Bacteroidaceae bacterium]